MEFTKTRMVVRIVAIVFATTVTHTTLAKGQDDASSNCLPSKFLVACPVQTTISAPTTLEQVTTDNGTTSNVTETLNEETTVRQTGWPATDETANVTLMYSEMLGTTQTATTPSGCLMCGNCTDYCNECFGVDEKECLRCSYGYTLRSEPENKRICKPCSWECYMQCADSNMNDVCHCMDEYEGCKSCLPDTEERKYGSCTLDTLGLPVIIGIAIGCTLFVVLVVIVCCFACRKLRPPKPVKKDYRPQANTQPDSRCQFSGFSSSEDEAENAFENPQVINDDSVYGNVDNRGNMMMINMPEETNVHVHVDCIPERLAPSIPTDITTQQDFGDVYENTTVSTRRPPEIPPKVKSPEREVEQDDFGGVYTNMEVSKKNLPLFPKNNFPVERQTPPLPRKTLLNETTEEPSFVPSLPKKPQGSQKDNLAFQGDTPLKPQPIRRGESEDVPTHAPPPLPSLPSNTLPLQMPPPMPERKSSSSLPFSTQRRDDVDKPSRALPLRPPMSSSAPVDGVSPRAGMALPSKPGDRPLPPVNNKNKKKNKKPVRQIDDEGIRDDIQIRSHPVPTTPVTPDYGGNYEVTLPVSSVPPQPDYGMSYEVVEISPQSPPKGDFGLSYNYAGPDNSSTQEDGDSDDYGDSYEQIEIPQSPDYGDTYEVVEQPSKPTKDIISMRAPLPLPNTGSVLAPAVKKKPSYKDANKPPFQMPRPPPRPKDPSDSPEEQDFGEDYTNVPPQGAHLSHKPTPIYHHRPALPQKISNVKPQEYVYDQAVNLGKTEAKARLEKFQETEGDGVYQNNQSAGVGNPKKVDRYRNVPTDAGTPTKLQGYIKFQRS